MSRQKPAPKVKAPVAEHKRHAKEFLAVEECKQPPTGFQPTDEANP